MLAKRNDPQLVVRLPGDMREWLKITARENGRSMNSEVVRAVRDLMKRERSGGGNGVPVENPATSGQTDGTGRITDL